jgi:CheY-like chemotaxis protein
LKKILIVDDRSEVRELVEVTLKSEEYQILQANSGTRAIEIAREQKPDLVLMDVMMPGKIDGIEAARIIKNDPATRGIIIIMLTSKGQVDDIKNGFAVGANDYFVKPFSPLDLIKKVEEMLS